MVSDLKTLAAMASPVALGLGLSLGINLAFVGQASAEFRFEPYGVLNANISNLDPDTGSSGFDVDDSTGLGFGVLLGADIFDRWSIEAGFNDLGAATLSSATTGDEDIDYTTFSFSTLFHIFGDSRDVAERSGFRTYLRLGVSKVDNDSNLELEEDDNVAVWAGIGVEYSVTTMLAVRAELATFDGDAQALSAGVVFRPFASGSSGSSQRPAVNRPPVPTPQPPVEPRQPIAPVAPVPQPSIQAQAPATRSGCEAPVFNEPVSRDGCAQLSGVQSGLQFVGETAQLTPDGNLAIGNIAGAMKAAPELRVEIRAHASSNRGPAAAQEVSRLRVVAVARALVAAGVSVNRLGARAFGNEEPTVSQGASAGQFLPDRIEFAVQR